MATEISIERNLDKCDHFKPMSTGVSPLALIKGMVSFSSALLFTGISIFFIIKILNVRASGDLREELAQPLLYMDYSGKLRIQQGKTA